MKKTYNRLFQAIETNKDVETNEKNRPIINKRIIKKRNLSIFFHHL